MSALAKEVPKHLTPGSNDDDIPTFDLFGSEESAIQTVDVRTRTGRYKVCLRTNDQVGVTSSSQSDPSTIPISIPG